MHNFEHGREFGVAVICGQDAEQGRVSLPISDTKTPICLAPSVPNVERGLRSCY